MNTEIFKSKKFIVTLVGLVILGVIKIFVEIPDELFVSLFSGVIASYLVSQGIADHGKGASEARREE